MNLPIGVTGPLVLGQPVAVTLDQPYQQGRYSFTLPSGSWFGWLSLTATLALR
jgi:hypothetical protein